MILWYYNRFSACVNLSCIAISEEGHWNERKKLEKERERERDKLCACALQNYKSSHTAIEYVFLHPYVYIRIYTLAYPMCTQSRRLSISSSFYNTIYVEIFCCRKFEAVLTEIIIICCFCLSYRLHLLPRRNFYLVLLK